MRTSRGTASGLTPVVEKKRSTRHVVGPTTSSVFTICSRNPATIEAIAMTVAMPMTTPRTVRPERSLLTRSCSNAMRQPSRTEWSFIYSWRSASIGSRRAARSAGKTPNKTPTTSPRLMATPIDHSVTRAGSGEIASTSPASPNPTTMPAMTPRIDSVNASAKNWRRMSRRAAPSALRTPISRVRSLAHQHDVHDHNAADDDADHHHRRHDGEDDARQLAPERDQPFAGIDREVVVGARAQPVRDAHRLFGAEHRGTHAVRGGHLDRDHHRLAAAVHRLERAQRQHHEAVPRLAQHRALLRDDAFDHELNPAHANRSSDCGLDVIEQLFGHVVAEHGHVATLLHIDVRERCARGERVVLDQDIGRRDAEDEDVAGRAVAPLHVRHRRGPPRLQRDRLRIGNGAFDEVDVLRRDDRAALDLLPLFVVDESHLDRIAPDLKRVDADDRAGEALAHVRVHALDDRHDGHEEGDRHDDAEQREEGPELVTPDGLESEAERFVEGHDLKLQCGIRNAE